MHKDRRHVDPIASPLIVANRGGGFCNRIGMDSGVQGADLFRCHY
jgi:hypothetical protein